MKGLVTGIATNRVRHIKDLLELSQDELEACIGIKVPNSKEIEPRDAIEVLDRVGRLEKVYQSIYTKVKHTYPQYTLLSHAEGMNVDCKPIPVLVHADMSDVLTLKLTKEAVRASNKSDICCYIQTGLYEETCEVALSNLFKSREANAPVKLTVFAKIKNTIKRIFENIIKSNKVTGEIVLRQLLNKHYGKNRLK